MEELKQINIILTTQNREKIKTIQEKHKYQNLNQTINHIINNYTEEQKDGKERR